jgi:hypothetical protein
MTITKDHQRLIDLVRYMRAELHQKDLISDDEYTELLGVTGSPDRLRGYDILKASGDRIAKELKMLADSMDGLLTSGIYVPGIATVNGARKALEDWGKV